MRKSLFVIIFAMGFLGYSPLSLSIDGNTPATLINNWAGTCGVLAIHVSGTSTAHVNLRDPNNNAPDGTRFVGGAITNIPAINATNIASNCGLTSVINLTTDGANGTYASDNYIGFSFRATDPANGETRDYEFALSGATGTVLINTRTLVASPAPSNPQAVPTLPPLLALLTAAMLGLIGWRNKKEAKS